MPNLVFDIEQAARSLRRSPGFTAAAVATLALGIAANTAIFSVVAKVLLEPLPYPHPGRLVQLMTTSQLGDQHVVSVPKFDVWRDRADVFEYIAAYDTSGPPVNLTDGELPQPFEAARVSADYFPLFGAGVVVGRTFTPAEDRSGGARVALISESLWRRHFKANPALVGNTISLDHAPCNIIGVIASGFAADKPFDVWLPLQADMAVADHISRVRVTGRLRAGITVADAAAAVAKTRPWFVRRYPSAPLLFGEEFTAIPLRDAMVGDVRPALLLLTGAVAFVLLIACANVGTLVLARSNRRTSEIAVRSALGAGRGRIIRQLLSESILLALGSGVAGMLLGLGGVRGLLILSPAELPRVGANGAAIALDWRVFLFTLAVSLASGILCGLLPAVRASQADLMSLVKESPAQSGMGLRRGGSRSALVIAQIALALVLLAGAALLIRAFVGARTTDRGFDEQHVLTAQMSLDGPQFERTAQVAQLVRQVERRIKQNRGISVAATTSALPLESALTMPFTITRHDQTLVGRYHGAAAWRSVSPGYFDAFHIRLLRGRLFSPEDNEQSAGVVLINRMMLKKFWQDVYANPIGEFLVVGKGMGPALEDTPRQIVGVVADVREAGLAREPMMYVPVSQLADGMTARNNRVLPVTWVIRADGQIPQAAVEHDLREASGGLPLGRVRTMHEVVATSTARAQFYVLLLTVFGAVALLLAAVGLYGVMSYTVEQRTREIGIRMALGALPDHIRNMVVWQGLRLALIGIGAGIPVALALTRVMESAIFGVRAWDPAVIAGVAALLAGVALAAAYSPSIRAARVSPCESLRR